MTSAAFHRSGQRALDRPPVKRQLKDDTAFESVDASFFRVDFMEEIAGLNRERDFRRAGL